MNTEQIAAICHQANRALCIANEDYSQMSWKDAPDWQRKSAVNGVNFVINNPNAPADANHVAWMNEKLSDGWKYGPVKDAEKKEHPCLVPFEELPKDQQAKDHLFRGIVIALAPFLE